VAIGEHQQKTSGDQLLDYLLEGDVVATRGFMLASAAAIRLRSSRAA
jgi:hypothetical protein